MEKIIYATIFALTHGKEGLVSQMAKLQSLEVPESGKTAIT
jgi:hypothetical protein